MLFALSFPSSQAHERPEFYALLFFGTLLVYWIDHLQDSEEPLLVQPGSRHSVFKTHKRLFIALCAVLFILNASLAFLFLNIKEWVYGFCLILALGGYLLLHRNLKRIFILEKELLIASLYCLSILFAPIAQFEGSFISYSFMSLLVAGSLLFLAALQNLFSIARIESQLDRENNIRNITHSFGSARLYHLQIALLAFQFLLSLAFLIMCGEPTKYKIAGVFMGISLVEFCLPYLFEEPQTNSYRFIGEGVFLLGFLAQ